MRSADAADPKQPQQPKAIPYPDLGGFPDYMKAGVSWKDQLEGDFRQALSFMELHGHSEMQAFVLDQEPPPQFDANASPWRDLELNGEQDFSLTTVKGLPCTTAVINKTLGFASSRKPPSKSQTKGFGRSRTSGRAPLPVPRSWGAGKRRVWAQAVFAISVFAGKCAWAK